MRRSILRLAEHASHNSHHGGVGSPPHVHGPAAIHRNAAIFLGATTTFYVLYKAYHEGAVFLGLKHPWDHGDHGGHGDGHEEGHSENHQESH